MKATGDRTPPSDAPHTDFTPAGRVPAGRTIAELSRIRDAHPVIRGGHSPGFWILTRYPDIRAALRDPELFSSSAITVLDPSPKYRWIPEMLDPPLHTTWRRLLRPWFTPAKAAAMRERIRDHCVQLIATLAPQGGCQFVAEFARQFPTAIFLELLGLPADHLDQFLQWNYAILHQDDHPSRSAARRDALIQVTHCLDELMASRRATPRDDLVTAALDFEIDGRRITTDELRGVLTMLFVAGLDTVTATLSYAFWHLATHPDDRRRLTSTPSVIPNATEELLRAYTITLTARKLTNDTEIAGCPMRSGDMVLLPLPSANRDPAAFAAPGQVDFDRPDNRHLAFGVGPHHCLGAHLARTELHIALAEWHNRIPDYQLTGDAQMYEHADQVLGIEELPLTWPTP